MTTPRVVVSLVKVLPDQSVQLMARVKNVSAELLTQASVGAAADAVVLTTSSVTVSNGVETVTQVAQRNIAKASCIYDTLQTGDEWDVDATGYNVAVTPQASELAGAGERYRYHLMITDSAGLPIPILWPDREARAVL